MWRYKSYVAGFADGDSAFNFENINTSSIHDRYVSKKLAMINTSFLIVSSIYKGLHTNGSFNLRKSNAANERPADFFAEVKYQEVKAKPLPYSFYQLKQFLAGCKGN